MRSKHRYTGSPPRRRLRVAVLLACAVLLLLPVVTLVAVVESTPIVTDSGRVNIDSAADTKRVARAIHAGLLGEDADRVSTIRVTAAELNGMIALAARGVPALSGRVSVGAAGVYGAFTLRLTSQPVLGRYYFINVTGLVPPSRRGIEIDHVVVGDLRIPGGFAQTLLRVAMNLVLGGEDIGAELLDAVESVSIAGTEVELSVRPVPGLERAVERAGRQARALREEFEPVASPTDVRAYYERLCELHGRIGGIVDVPLGYYLGEAFTAAHERSARGADPVAQNRAAILALAILLGSPRFDSVVGAVDRETRQRCQPRDGDIVLGGRSDLRLHFVYSAALEVIGNSEVSFAIGETKELLDAQAGGTGFSFRDLAADRSGIRLARFASSASGARRLQQMAGQLAVEDVYFPSLEQLPERIRREELQRRGGLEGEYYRSHLALIERRIERLPLYQ